MSRDESKATAGPWAYHGEQMKRDSSRVVYGADGRVVAFAVDFNSYGRDAESEASAALIASAPALLAERDAALDRCDSAQAQVREARNDAIIAEDKLHDALAREAGLREALAEALAYAEAFARAARAGKAGA